VHRIARFQEKPTPALAQHLFDTGCLWNTFVLAARVQALVEAGRRCLPRLHERLERVSLLRGTEHEGWAVRQAYELAPTASFSRAVLQAESTPLGMVKLDGAAWCDLGTPGRVLGLMGRLGLHAPWIDRLQMAR
jgi:mannose-1-phosphate guanylyltransferase